VEAGGGIRRALAPLIGNQRWEQFSRVVFRSARAESSRRLDTETHHAAFAAAGLSVEERAAPFTVTWQGVVEWVRVRWLEVASADERTSAESVLTEIGCECADASFDLAEKMLIGRKQA
ncbi:MAG: hypothetical protein ACREQF_05595, partial [Candidatus Binataceae bacterium]